MNRLRSLVAVLLFFIEGSLCAMYLPDMYRFLGCKDICADPELEKYLNEVSWLPTTELELNTFCPAATKYTSCVITECAMSNTSGIPLHSDIMQMMLKQQYLATQICTPGTKLRQSYLSVVVCVKEKVIHDYQTSYGCTRESEDKYKNYTQWIGYLSKNASDEKRIEWSCLTTAYYYHCIGEIIRSRCGGDASDITMGILKKVGILDMRCNGGDACNWQIKFLDFLKLDNGKRQRYASFIDSLGEETNDNEHINHCNAKNHSSKHMPLYALIYAFMIMKYVFLW